MTVSGDRRASATDAAILETVRRRTETTRVELARELGVTPATVTYAVKRLMAAGLLVESGYARSNGGKRASLLRLNDGARWAAGCTIDAGRLSMVAVDMTGALRSRAVLPLPPHPTVEELLAAVRRALQMMTPSEDLASSTTGIGLAAGPTETGDAGAGQAEAGQTEAGSAEAGRAEAGDAGADERLPLTARLLAAMREDLGIPVVSASTPVCAALGSFWSGEQPETGLSATLHMDAGLSLALLVDGSPLGAAPGATLDHACVDPTGPVCACGQRGCLTLYASPRAIVDAAADSPELVATLGLALTPESVTGDLVLISLAANRGDQPARAILEDAMGAIAQVLSTVTSALGVDSVTLSGAGIQAAPVLAHRVVGRRIGAPGAPGPTTALGVSQVQPHPAAVGAAVLALKSSMDPSRP
ncbi:ROK family protein [Brachybacterium sp. DNPG3]